MKVIAKAPMRRLGVAVGTGLVLLVALASFAAVGGQQALANFGPYNAQFLMGGVGLRESLAADAPVLAAGAPWTIHGWVQIDRTDGGPLVVAALGDADQARSRCLLVEAGRFSVRIDGRELVAARVPVEPHSWHSVAVAYDGQRVSLYIDGEERGAAPVQTTMVAPTFSLAPESASDPAGAHHFGGSLAKLSLVAAAMQAGDLRTLARTPPEFALIAFHQVGVGWPWQEHSWRGLLEPQPAWTLPHGHAQPSAPAKALPAVGEPLRAVRPDAWTLERWRLAIGSEVSTKPLHPSVTGYGDAAWYQAIVPGTVLTTLIANGVYPDPDYGLNNLAIPESLNRQDYWYRTEFPTPPVAPGRRLVLTFKGINYDADVWLNGVRLGGIRGAFIRGVFDVTGLLRAGAANALAVRVSPPPHPGIPHEQSVSAGPGPNGGNLAIDGPTFIATEGWDWIPAIRDRNTGLWQSVELSASGALRILDPQVVSRLPLPRTDSADLDIRVPVENSNTAPVQAEVEARVAGVRASKTVTIAPGVTEIRLGVDEFPQLHLTHPRLWWPNGYGAPELYALDLSVRGDGAPSDARTVRFGIRELSYELSLFDHTGRLRRVEVDPAAGSAHGERLVDVRHEAIKRTATGWAESLTREGETSTAVHELPSVSLTPYLVIRVNGVPIAARGGSWGTDDSRKRVGRDRLEPYFRLHRDAHLNIIRNWLGQNTEDVFYDLADEYGLLILNDFWASTQDFQMEPQDPELFLKNAADVIRRYRNHPSIAVWFGRNEGVPQPIINEGMAELTAKLDGTRYYTGSSNSVNLQGSGPYNWRAPGEYFTTLAQGFSVEVGTPSLASLDSLRASIPTEDLWPIGDVYAYHDWHFGGNGDTASFTQALERGLGKPDALEDFERKAQMMNYDSYRAVFEGFQSQLWTRNSGRLLWMTHPSWPSNSWQIYTSDYDTPAAYYAVAKACEPVHAQLNLPDYRLAVVNTTREVRHGLELRARVLSLQGALLSERVDRVEAAANSVTTLRALPLQELLEAERVALVSLELRDATDHVLSTNLYWETATDADQRRLSAMPAQALDLTATSRPAGEGTAVEIQIRNPGRVPVLLARLTLQDSAGRRVLPVYYSDNYLSVMPGKVARVSAVCPGHGSTCTSVAIRGWNVVPATVPVNGVAERRSPPP